MSSNSFLGLVDVNPLFKGVKSVEYEGFRIYSIKCNNAIKLQARKTE